MSKTFQNAILSLNVRFDLNEWIETFEGLLATNTKPDLPEGIAELGPTTFATVVMGIVENKAREKNLVKGTTEPLRHEALSLFIGTVTEAAFWNGQADMMNYLVNGRPELAQFFNEAHLKRCSHRVDFRTKVISQALLILKEIRAQQLRKGNTGRPSEGTNLNAHPSRKLRDSIDEAILHDAIGRLPHINRKDFELIKQQVRIGVKDFLSREILTQSEAGYKESVDVHFKRIIRKSNTHPPKNQK